jgi:hypothetical protein
VNCNYGHSTQDGKWKEENNTTMCLEKLQQLLEDQGMYEQMLHNLLKM